MKLPLIFLSALLGIAHGQQTPPSKHAKAPFGKGCLVPDAPSSSQAQIQNLRAVSTSTLPSTIKVDVYFHIASTVNDTDLITQEILDAQWKVLQAAYAKQNIFLTLKGTDRIVDDKAGQYFFVDESTGEFPKYVEYLQERNAYLRSTRKGGYDALNLYFFSRYLPGATGYCSFPTTGAVEGSDVLGLDGCAVSGLTMPGIRAEDGGNEEYNGGHIAVHEAGHWFGLNHTFVGGCNANSPGDFVADTPAHRIVYGCPVGSDSCPDLPGLDPIHNYMGYTDDTCTNEFTPGQQQRMFETFYAFRRTPPPASPAKRCNADNCLRALRATTIPGRPAEARKMCASFMASVYTRPTRLPKYATDGCKGDTVSRVSSACGCLSTGPP